jgi:DNA-binding response OmpR family regulator/curved DNA-binding protein CbpA
LIRIFVNRVYSCGANSVLNTVFKYFLVRRSRRPYDWKCMAKRQFNVLVIEDDMSQGKAFTEAFKRAGFKASLCSSAGEALTQTQRAEFDLLIVDCVLPKINGINVAEKIINKMTRKPVVIFVSGILKNRNSIREALGRFQDNAFFTKPVDLRELLNHAQRVLEERDNQSPPLLKLYSSRPMDDRGIAGLIASQSTIHAFHLPKLFHRLMETGAGGELTVTPTAGEPSAIRFHQGRIFAVDPPDRESYFGRLAVRNRFADPKDVSEALKNPKNKPLGQNLVDALAISPHAVRVIVTQQLELRLDRTIRDKVVSLNWENHDYSKPEISLAQSRLEALIDDWLRSKITAEWIRSMFILWGSFEIEGDYDPRVHGPQTIESIFTDPGFNVENTIPKMFRSLLKGKSHMGKRGSLSVDYSVFEARLDKLTCEFETEDYYQILGLKESAHMHEINKAVRHLEDAFDPTHLPDDCPASLVEKCTDVFTQIQRAKDILSDDHERKKYLHEIRGTRTQRRQEAELQFRAAVQDLLNGHHSRAAASLQHLIEKRQAFKDLHSYWLWASIKCNRNPGKTGFDQVPLDERNSPEYMMAKGVYFRAKRRFKEAIACLQKAHDLNPNLKLASLEYQSLMRELEQDRLRREGA